MTATLRSLNVEEDGEDNAIYSAYRFTPAFELELKDERGVASVIIHFCTNSEGDNDMAPEGIRDLLLVELAKAELR